MKIRVYLALLTALLLKIHGHAQIMDYQMLKAINSNRALINYLEQNNFKDASHPDSSFLYYEGQYKGDYLKMGKGWNDEVFEMGWAVVDEAGNTIPERLMLGDIRLMPTYKENRKLHPSVFNARKRDPNGTWDFVNFGLGESKIEYNFDEASGSRNPKLIQFTMLRPNNNKRNLSAMNSRSRYLEDLAVANIPEGIDSLGSEVVERIIEVAKNTALQFKSFQSLTLKKDEIVLLDLPYSLLDRSKNQEAVLLVKTTKTETFTGTETFAHINFKVTTESGEYIGDSNSLGKGRNTREWITPAFNLTNSLDEKVSFKAEISITHDAEINVYYFEGPNTHNQEINFAYNTKKILEKRDYIPPYIDAFTKSIQTIKGTSIFDPEISKDALPASGKTVIYNQPGSGSHIFLVKSEGQMAPTIKLDYELWWNEGDNRGNLTLDQNDKSYRLVDGFHLFEFQLNLVHTAWIKAEVINNEDKPHHLSWHSRYRKLDSTFVKYDIAETFHSRTEEYFERIIARNTVDPDRVKRAMEDFKNFGEENSRTKNEYLNAVENRIMAGLVAGDNLTKANNRILGLLKSGQNGRATFKQLMDSYKEFKEHISEATLNAIKGKCDAAYEILNNVEDDWFGYSGEAIQVDIANMENAVNTDNLQGFARWTEDFTKSMLLIAKKLENGLLAAKGCR